MKIEKELMVLSKKFKNIAGAVRDALKNKNIIR